MRRILPGIAVVLAVSGLFVLRPAVIEALDYKVYDLLTNWVPSGRPSGKVIVVAIDEQSLAKLGRWPWPRDLLGSVVNRIFDYGATVVVLDMMLPEQDRETPLSIHTVDPQNITNDDVLAGALSGKPTVIGYSLSFDRNSASPARCALPPLPLVVVGSDHVESRTFFQASGAVCNVPEVSRTAAGSGFLNAAPDSDGKLRRIPLVIEYDQQHYPSLALAALGVYRPATQVQITANINGALSLSLDQRVIPLEGRSFMRLRFRGAQRTFPYLSAADVLAGHIPADQFRDKIAVVGWVASGLQMNAVIPFDPMFPSVEVQATAIDNLLQGDVFRRSGEAQAGEILLALVAGLASTLLLALIRSLWGTWITFAMAAGLWMGCILVLSMTGVLVSPLPATSTLACAYSVLTLINYRLEKRRADQTQQQLVSAEELAKEVLSESERRYQRLIENVNDAIIMDDFEGRLVFANRRFQELFGLRGENIPEMILEDFVAPEWRRQLRDQHDRRVRGEVTPESFEFEGLRADGTRIWIEALVTEVRENGRIVGTQSALRDTTERKRMEAQYLQAQKMESVGRLAGGVAHDFNNLLTVINGYSSLLLTRIGPESPLRGQLEEIQRAGEHAVELTQKLLTLSRKHVIQPKRMNLNHVVADAKKLFDRLVGEDIELIIRPGTNLGMVRADSGHLNQVLMNLVVNARDAMPNGGKLIIETRDVKVTEQDSAQHPGVEYGAYVYLGVTDTGVGMSQEVQQHLFEPFFTTKEQGKGTGLGLSTVYGIVRENGGWIRICSRVGGGTTFHIYLPWYPMDLLEEANSFTSTVPPGGSETVLLVEDQDDVRQVTKVVLEGYGYNVLQASDGHAAIGLAKQHPEIIHLLLTDVVLPKMNGRELADALKTIRPDMKVLYVSGYTNDIISRHGVLDSDVAYLAKPFNHVTLAAKIREVLAS